MRLHNRVEVVRVRTAGTGQRELALGALESGLSQPGGQFGGQQKNKNEYGELIGVPEIDQIPLFAVTDQFAVAADVDGHDWESCRHISQERRGAALSV